MATPTATRSRDLQSPLRHDPDALRWAMDMAGFNQKALCEATGISKRLMSEIVNGTRNATAPNLKLIADALRCPVPMLLAKDAA